MKKNIDSHIPYVTGKEIYYLKKVLKKKKFSGRGFFSKKCEKIISNNYKKHEVLLTTSCTDALEMAAILLNIKAGDEVILPSYTFVSTANAFVLRGAKLIFVDTYNSHPCIDASQIEKKITKKTKCICIIHYASISCDMNQILRICKKYKIKLVEDCANAMGSFYKKKKLGLFGDLSTFSFHDTKNITSGEGGALLINNKEFVNRAKIILEKGTNRSDFLKGKINKYQWVDIGSSYALSEINCAFLYAQLKKENFITKKRISIYKYYFKNLIKFQNKKLFKLPYVPNYAKINGHSFYITMNSKKEKSDLKKIMQEKGIQLSSHYECLHNSLFYKRKNRLIKLKNSEYFSDNLLRLPIYPDLTKNDLKKIVGNFNSYYQHKI